MSKSKALTTTKLVLAAVEDKLAEADIGKNAAKVMADQEIERRTGIVVNAFGAVNILKAKIEAIKGTEAYNDKGKVVSTTFSKGDLDQRDKLEKKISKILKAVDKAVDKDAGEKEFDKLTMVVRENR